MGIEMRHEARQVPSWLIFDVSQAMQNIIRFSISLPTDEGFLGHACDAPKCRQYFKVHSEDRTENMHCPYCGLQFDQSKLRTTDQSRHIRKAVEAEAKFYAEQEVQKMFKKAFGKRGTSGSGVSFSYRPSPIQKRSVVPAYRERTLDKELKCSVCQCRFQIYGIFGYCPRCSESSIAIYDTNWAIIEREVIEAQNPKRVLRHAYGDIVSAFENFCTSKARRLVAPSVSFQVLFDARKYFKDQMGVDMLQDISTDKLLTLRRVFQKRHACIHAEGRITDRYVRMIPEDKDLLGQEVELSIDELSEGAAAMRQAMGKIVKAMEEPGKIG